MAGFDFQSRELHVKGREGAIEDDLLDVRQFLLERFVCDFDHFNTLRHDANE